MRCRFVSGISAAGESEVKYSYCRTAGTVEANAAPEALDFGLLAAVSEVIIKGEIVLFSGKTFAKTTSSDFFISHGPKNKLCGQNAYMSNPAKAKPKMTASGRKGERLMVLNIGIGAI
jgi:hypothetical protein